MMNRHPFVLIVLLLATACTLTPEYQRPVLDVSENWKEQAGTREAAPAHTPEVLTLGNAELAALLAKAEAENREIRASLHRIAQARANVRVVRAALFPAIHATASAGKDYARPANQSSTDESSGGLGASVSYEADLFGRNRADAASAAFSADAAGFDRDALALLIRAEVARTYALILALEDRLSVARNNLKNSGDILMITEARFTEGAASRLEVAQQQTVLANTEASLAELERQRRTALHALAVLTGQPPESFRMQGSSLQNLVLPDVAAGQPSALLEQRPDIRRAEASLKAANADIGAARAAFFPAITLGVDAALSAAPITGPAGSLVSLGAALLQPIFRGGELSGRLDAATAREQELAATYQQTVLNAFREVEDALAAMAASAEREKSLTAGESAAQEAYRIARERFDAGATDFLTLLEAQRNLLQTQDNLVQARLNRFLAVVDVYAALGGTWHNHSSGDTGSNAGSAGDSKTLAR